MAKKRRKRQASPAPSPSAGPSRGGGRRVAIAAAVVTALAWLAWSAWSSRPPAPIPELETDDMEAQVAEKLEATRDLVVEEPRSAEAWGRLGLVFHAHERFAEAAQSYAVAMGLSAADERWPYLRAQCLKELREFDEARLALSEAIALSGDYVPHYVLLGEIEERAGDSAAAERAYRTALDVDETCAPAHFGIGRLRLAAGAVDDAGRHLERASALAPDAGAIQATLARFYRRQGDRERSARAATRAKSLHPAVSLDDPVMASVVNEAVSVVGLQRRATEAESRGDAVGAEGLLRQVIELRPEEADVHYNLGNNLARQGRYEEAVASYRQAIARRDDHVAARVNLGNVLSQQGDVAQAERLFREALEIEPRHAGALSSLAKVAITKGARAQAVGLLEASLAQDPTSAESHYVLAQLLRAAGRREASVASFERALVHAPGRGDIRVDLAVTFAEMGRFVDAWNQVYESQRVGWAPPPEFLTALRARMPDPRNH